MPTLTAGTVYAYARAAGFTPAEAVTATAIAAGESRFNTTAVGDTTIQTSKWGPSVGLWQVRSLKADYGTGRTRDASRLSDPAFNAKAARQIYLDAKGWTPWSVFTSGAYEQYLTSARGAAMSTGVVLPTNSTGSGTTGSVTSVGTSTGVLDGIAGGVGGAATDAVAASMEGIWGKVQPFLVTSTVLVLGLGLIGAGVIVTAWPTTSKAASTAIDLVPPEA